MAAPLVLMTDFGTSDSYVGVMKGVIAGIAPGTAVIDLSHEIRPQDVAHGAYTLAISVPYFPAGTIFCCVVDPGVGSARRAVAVEAANWRFVLPDNGLLTPILDKWPARRIVALTNRAYQLAKLSRTFHGRDIFAPAAAHLAAGLPLDALGEAVPANSLSRLFLPRPQHSDEGLTGAVIHIDRFGNLITSITSADLQDRRDWQIAMAGLDITLTHLSATFADAAPGEPVAYIGSDGYLELALRNGNAATAWSVRVGDAVTAVATPEEHPL